MRSYKTKITILKLLYWKGNKNKMRNYQTEIITESIIKKNANEASHNARKNNSNECGTFYIKWDRNANFEINAYNVQL